MLLEFDAVFFSFVLPPTRYDVEAQSPRSSDVVDVGSLFGQQCRRVEGGAYGDHPLDALGQGHQRSGRRPSVERGGIGPLDVVEVQFGDQTQVETELFAPLRKPLAVVPGPLHGLVGHVPEPTTEDG